MSTLPSLYAADKDTSLIRVKPPELTDKMPQKDKYPGEDTVKRALYKYGFMTKRLLKRHMDVLGNDRLDSGKTLDHLVARESALRYEICQKDGSTIDIYTLSDDENKVLQKRSGINAVYKRDMQDIPYLLETLSIEQWHIALLENKGKEILYNARLDSGMPVLPTIVPSLVRMKKKGGSVAVAGIPAPRGQDKGTLGMFLKETLELSDFLVKRPTKFPRFVLVVICTSESQAGDIAAVFHHMKETEQAFFLYSYDYITKTEGNNPMRLLYDITQGDAGPKMTVIDMS